MQSVTTKLSLDRWARIMGIPPMHFWGVNIPEMERGVCSQAWFQYGWQDSDRISRDDVAQAIADAEREIEQIVGYRLLPTWEEDEWRPTVRPYRRAAVNLGLRDLRGYGQIVEANWGYMLTGGIRSVETLDASAAIVYSNDGTAPTTYTNVATVQFTASDEFPDDEIALYYPGHDGDDRWRIRPVNVSHNSATLLYTVTFTREMALLPTFFENYNPAEIRAALGTDDANFLEEVAVCRVYNDPQQQVTMLWEGGGCGSCQACAYGTQTGCFLVRDDPRLSMIVYQPATWNAADEAFDPAYLSTCRQPDLLRLWYYAGWRDKAAAHPTIEMDDQWARTVAYLAASKLDRKVCACTTDRFEHWQQDLAFGGGAEQISVYNTSPSDLGNPLGTKRGAVQAWHRINVPGIVVAKSA